MTSRKQRGDANACSSADPAICLLALSVGWLQPCHRAPRQAPWDEMCEHFPTFMFAQLCQAFPGEVSRTDHSFLLFPFLCVPLGCWEQNRSGVVQGSLYSNSAKLQEKCCLAQNQSLVPLVLTPFQSRPLSNGCHHWSPGPTNTCPSAKAANALQAGRPPLGVTSDVHTFIQ